jgi:hypothetical protein
MAHPHNSAQETPRLLAAMPEVFQYWVGTVGVRSSRSSDIECLVL